MSRMDLEKPKGFLEELLTELSHLDIEVVDLVGEDEFDKIMGIEHDDDEEGN